MNTSPEKPNLGKSSLRKKRIRRIEGYLIHHINSMKPARRMRAIKNIYHD